MNLTRTFITFLLVLGICQRSLLENTKDEQEDLMYRLQPGIVMPIEYELHIMPDFSKSAFLGEVHITLVALTTDRILELNAKNLYIDNIKFVDLDTRETLENKWTLDAKHEILNITIKPQFRRDRHYSLQIKYMGALMQYLRGFYTSEIVREGGIFGRVAITNFKPTYARRAFPCWDEPIYKAKFKISLTHDKTLQAISNTDVLKREDRGDMVTTYFRETPPMSTHSVAFMISDYQFKEYKFGRFTYRVWSKESSIHKTGHALKMGTKLLERLNRYTGVQYQKYMPDKIDQVLVEDSFPITEGENWGLVVYRESSVVYDEILSSTRAKINAHVIPARMITRQWFGNLVSLKWWKYVPVYEGLATYFQYYIAHKIVPEFRLDEMFVVDVMQNVMDIDWIQGLRLNLNVTTTQEIISSLNSVFIFDKGASIIRMVSHALTEYSFRKGLQIYLKDKALGNADSNDLFESLDLTLPKGDFVDQLWSMTVKDLMKNWMENEGYPVLRVKNLLEGYQLTQEPFLFRIGRRNDDEYFSKWWIPINYAKESNPNFNYTDPVYWFPPHSESYFIRCMNTTGWIVFNMQQTGYYRVNYDIKNWILLMNELNEGNYTKIHVLNRAQIVDDAFALAQAGYLDYSIPLGVSLYLTKETDYMPWQSAFRHLKFLRNKFRTPKQYYIFRLYVAYLMKGLTKNVGYEPKENDSDIVKMLRADAMKWACEFGVEECTSYAKEMHEQWLNIRYMKLDDNLKIEILCAGVRYTNRKGWTDTLKRITASKLDEKDRMDQLTALACSNSSRILSKYLNSTLNRGYIIDFKTAAIHVLSRSPFGAQLVLDFLLEEFSRIVELPDYHYAMRAILPELGVLMMHTNKDLHRLINFMMKNKLMSLWNSFRSRLNLNDVWDKRYKPTVDQWMSANSNLFKSSDNGVYTDIWKTAIALLAILMIALIYNPFR